MPEKVAIYDPDEITRLAKKYAVTNGCTIMEHGVPMYNVIWKICVGTYSVKPLILVAFYVEGSNLRTGTFLLKGPPSEGDNDS